MMPGRKLLYHRGVDDNIGTYVTDYVFAGFCGLLCIQLLLRARREKKKLTEKQEEATSCFRIGNILPWNWPKSHVSAVTMTTYGVIMLGFANMAMALLGGLTHQFLQTVEKVPDEPLDLRGWLIEWRFAAAFAAVFSFAVLVMCEQLIVQEDLFRIRPVVRKVYYIIITIVCVGFFVFNFLPLMKYDPDPFSIRNTYMATFAVMFVYGVLAIAVIVKEYCCCCCQRDIPTWNVEFVDDCPSEKKTDKSPYIQNIYECCKNVAVSYQDNERIVNSRHIELLLTAASPWIYIAAGAINHFLKSKCSDSDDAAGELGCPLPNAFNHNSLMHVIQIVSLLCFFIAENISMTRRRFICASESGLKRARTSSTLYNDVSSSCTIDTPDVIVNEKSPLKEAYLNNNHIPHSRDDVLCEVISDDIEQKVTELISEASLRDDVTAMPRFPTTLNVVTECPISNNRSSVYDNMVHKGV